MPAACKRNMKKQRVDYIKTVQAAKRNQLAINKEAKLCYQTIES
jgi:hypothetical protein